MEHLDSLTTSWPSRGSHPSKVLANSIRLCDVCGSEFTPHNVKHLRCSSVCSKKANNRSGAQFQTLNCEGCSEEFTQTRTTQRFCSPACREKSKKLRFAENKGPYSGEYFARIARASKYRLKYGIALEDFETLVEHQVVCEICNQKKELIADHEHSSSTFRGAICRACNTGLGHFYDNPDSLVAAAAYLIKFQERFTAVTTTTIFQDH